MSELRRVSLAKCDVQVKRARSKQLAPDEFNSGTFTISNLGNFGADSFDAILPPGELLACSGTEGKESSSGEDARV